MAVRMSAERFFFQSALDARWFCTWKDTNAAVEKEKELNALLKTPKTLYEVNKSQLQSSMYNVILF